LQQVQTCIESTAGFNPNCYVKGEAAALSVRAQRCQSHYFSATPRIQQQVHVVLKRGMFKILNVSLFSTSWFLLHRSNSVFLSIKHCYFL